MRGIEPDRPAPGTASVQDALNGSTNWIDVDVSQRQRVLSDPKFYETGQITRYPKWMQQQILADPAFQWSRLPKWQKTYFDLSSNPAAMGAAQGAIMGLGGGPAGGAAGGVLGGVLGYGAAKSGYDPSKEAWQQANPIAGAFGWLNFLAEQAEKTVGVSLQLSQAQNFSDVTEVLSREGWEAGSTTFEVFGPVLGDAAKKRVQELAKHPELIGTDLLQLVTFQWLGQRAMDAILNPEKFKGQELILGAELPQDLQQSFNDRLQEARDRIAAGENYREVVLDYQNGVVAQLSDMAGQGIADPLNYLPRTTTITGGALADMTGNKVAAEAFKQSSAPTEAARRYRTLVQTGQARVIDPLFRVDQMGALSRFIAGINDEGKVRAGPFSKVGLLDKPGKTGWVEQLASLTPESRAQIGAGMFYENLGALLTHFEDPHEAGKYLRALAGNDLETWAELGSRFADSPEFYTVLPALREFNTGALENVIAQWDVSEPNRTALLRIADVLGQEPAKLISELADSGTKEQDFSRIQDRLRASQSPQAKLILDDIAAGRFTPDTLGQIVDVFTGEGAIPWHPGQWKASMLDELGKHFDTWAVKNFDLKPDSGFFRFAHLMKSAQSVLLLGASPSYALTNGMSNMIHRAATGIYGYLTSAEINSWMDRFGVRPARFEEGYGMAGAVEQATETTAVRTEAIRQAKRGEGAIRQAHDIVSKIGQKMPMNKLSSWFEKLESKQGFAIAMRDFWSQSWRRGVGFQRMPAELARAMQDSGINPDHIYSAIEAGMSQEDVQRVIFGRQEGIQSRSLVHEAAQRIGIASSEAASMLEKVGAFDALDGYLKGARTRDQLSKAFDRAAARAQDEIDLAASRDAIARAEHISNRVGIEGAKALTDIITDVEMQGIEKWLEHYERMGQAAEALDLVEPQARAQLWDMKYRESNAEFRRYNALKGSTYLGVLKAVGLEANQHARQWLTTLADIDKTMDQAYGFMREQRNNHFQKWKDDWDNPDQFTERDRIENKIDREFKRAMKQEDVNLSKMGELLGRQYEQLFGEVAGEAARQAWEKIIAFRKEMVSRQQDFRDNQKQARAAGVPLELRQQAAKEFWQTTYKYMIVEMATLKQDAISELDRIARGGGAGPIDRTPTDPTMPPGETPDETAALRQAAEERRQAQRAAVSSIWDIAEQFSKAQPGDTGLFSRGTLQDKFILLADLKKAEYGGDPSITDLNDAALKLTPEQIQQLFETRRQIKEQSQLIDAVEREARRPEVVEKAKKKVKKMSDTTILQAIRAQGGIDISVKDVRADIGEGWQPGVFSKTGKDRWAIDDMARILATEWDFPINLDDPADPGGVGQLIDMMQRAQRGEKIYPTTHDYEADIARAEAEHMAELEETGEIPPAAEIEERVARAVETQQAEATQAWEESVNGAILAGDLGAMADLMGEIPEGTRPDGESYGDWIARQWDEVDQRVQKEAQDLAIAENMTRAQLAIEDQQASADIAMTRQLLVDKYEQAFPNVSKAEIDSWMEVSDAALSTLARITGQTLEEMYSFYRDVLRGEPTAGALFQDAWHGSPYKFDKFTTDKIGAGEGHQSFGWGLYFAGEKAVAEHYRQRLSMDRAINEINGMLSNVARKLQAARTEKVIARDIDTSNRFEAEIYRLQDQYDDLLLKRSRIQLDQEKAGQTYRVQLPDDDYLLWDKPFSEQSPNAQRAILEMAQRHRKGATRNGKTLLERLIEEDARGGLLYESLATQIEGQNVRADKSASVALRDAGLSGIKYLDQMSRNRGEGSYNFVVFDDEAVRIVETLYQGQPLGQPAKGGVDFIDGRAIIHAFEQGDISTIVHENGHVFLQMMRDAGRRTGNVKLIDDLAAFNDWARLDQQGEVWTAANGNGQHSIKKYGDTYIYRNPSGDAREFTSFDDARFVLEQEMFARGFEKYLAEGKAPTAKLKRVFENFKKWIANIYKAITGSVIDVNLTDDMRGVFNRLLGEQEAIDKILGSGDQRRPAYEALRQTWDTLDEEQQAEAISLILQRTLVDPLSGLETLVAKDMSGGTKPEGWVDVMSDLNGLKAINDTWGHDAGDLLIKVIGRIAKAEVDKVGGRAFRVGGDEFSYWFPDTATARAAMEAIDQAVQNEVVNVGGEDRTGFSVGYGIGQTLKDADTDLYRDKARRVEMGQRSSERGGMPESIRISSKAPTEVAIIEETTPPPKSYAQGRGEGLDPFETPDPYLDALGAITYQRVNRLKDKKYRFQYGPMDDATFNDVTGIISLKYAERLRDAGLTVVRIDEAPAVTPETAMSAIEPDLAPPEAAVKDSLISEVPPEAALLATPGTLPTELAVTPETPPEVAVPAEQQLGMFATEDMPLFSQTPQPATEEVFAPRPETRQESFIETRPEFGQRLEENLIKLKAADEALKVGDTFDYNGRRYQLDEVEADRVEARDITGAYPINRVWDREQFSRTGQVLADDLLNNLVPEERPTPNVTREKALLDALADRLSRKEWFAKSRDFEGYIKSLGFDIENETDLNLAYDLMEGAYNLEARKIRADLDSRNAPLAERLAAMDELESNLTEARRTLGKMKLQQFSTPLTISEAAGHVADVRPGDIVGEPTAGTANLVDKFSQRKDVTVRVNEIDPGRQEVLRQIGYDPTGMNLMGTDWLIEDGRKAGTWATVQISNPPWGSYSTGKYGKATNTPVKLNDWSQRFTFLAMQRLANDGRFVGVMPTNWLYSMDRATGAITNKPSEFYKWLKKNYSVQAVIESPPGAYKQRATDISSLLVVIDKTPHLLDDVPTIERYGDTQPKTWEEYAAMVESVPKRTEGAIAHVTEQTRPIATGPDTTGIVDPAARRGEPRGDIDRIGEPSEAVIQRTPRRQRVTEPGTEPDAIRPTVRDSSDVAQPGEPEDTRVVAEQPAAIPDEPDGFTYSDAFHERLVAGRAAVKDSRSFTEYVGRAPLEQSDVIHPHPNTVVETKGLAGVPYPPLEEAYRPSPSVMSAMKRRVLSYDGNLDPVWAAIQQNDKNKMGMLIADDVGMGKSRSAAAFVLDRIEKGRKRILVVTKDQQNVLNLMNQEFPQVYKGVANENGGFEGPPPTDYPAQRVFLSGENFPKVKKNEAPIPTFDEPAVYFVTSSEFMHFIEQLKTLKPDAVVVDEAHLFKNVGNTSRGVSWVELHKEWLSRDVSMLYLTATPGVDLSDLQYLYGLKVWTMDGFGDWIKVITGQESPEKIKAKQQSAAVADEWVTRVQTAREAIDAQPVEIQGPHGQEWQGLKVGDVSVWRSTEKWNNGRYYYQWGDKSNTFQTTNELEAVIVADAVNRKLASQPAGVNVSYSDLNNMFYDAVNDFVDAFKPPDREVIRSLGIAEIKEAGDILKQAEKKKWGKSKGIGAFDATLPPAHTEQIMRELKVTGSYMARDISRAGVDFDTLEYTPPPAAKRSFNKRVEIYRRIYDAWRKFGKMNEGPKKMAAMFGVNGDIQADAKRALFNMRLPGVIAEADAAIARGEQAVISVVSVSEVDGESGSLVSAIDKINTKSVEKVGKDEYTDPTDIPEAILEINDLKDELKRLDALPSPIDVLREKYGDRIAFVTGATPTKDRIQAQRDFQANKLDVIVISGAGKTGINLHDVTGRKRISLIVGDYEWSATNFKQELGRVDRTGQRSSPKVRVMHTGSAAERKFVATISNRMKGLGATSKGGAESTGTGAMTEMFEMGGEMDKIALNAMWQDLPTEQRAKFLDRYFEDKNISGGEERYMRDTLDQNSEALAKFLMGLQSIEIDDANAIMEAYISKRTELQASTSDAPDAESVKTADNTGEILRQVELGDNLRLSEVRNVDGQKFAVLDGVLTPHMNSVKDVFQRNIQLGLGNSWMQWVQFYDEGKNQYVTGLRVMPSKVKDLVEHFGQRLGSMHRPETAMVDLRAGDRIKITGANAAEWELYIGKGGARADKIVIDNARIKDKDAMLKNGAAYNAVGNFFFVPEANLDQFFKRFPINNDEATPPPTLYQDTPITPNAQPEMPMGGYEQAASWLPESEVRDEGWSQHVRPLLDAMKDTALNRMNSKPLDGAVRDMSPEGQDMLQKYLAQVQGDMATTKLATMRWGENQRDSAMFNYNRRYGFDKLLDVPYPYQFFYGRAAMKWLSMGLDGPAWFSNYARIQKQQNRYERDIPERLRGKIKIPAPWMPDWMGDSLYIDPIGSLFPPDNFLRPFERMQQDKNTQLIEAERILQEWSQDGQVSEPEILQAVRTRSGPVWERAFAEAQMRRESEISNPMDFFASTFGPAWWMSAPLNMAGIEVPGISKGDPNKVSNLPITNTARGIQAVTRGTWAEPAGELIGLLGKPEEWARKQAGLPTMGQYGEYYTKRAIAGMVAEGLIDSEQAQLAMIEQQGPVWDQATERVQLELAMRVPTLGAAYAGLHEGPKGLAQAALPSLFGSGLLPAGELEFRGLKGEWDQAWKQYDAGNKGAVNEFFDKHPEYEAWLAKGKDDKELLKSFLIGQVWDGYMELGPTNQKAARSQMGEDFQQAFLDKETRSYDSIDTETLTQWAQMLKQMVPQAVEGQPVQTPAAPQLDLYDPNVTDVTDEFFRQRTKYHPDYYELEQGYFNLPKRQRPSYLLKNPELKEYWDWKDGWFDAYPDLEPVFRGQVFKQVDVSGWPPGLVDYVTQYAYTGKRLPSGARKALEQQWIMEGRPYDDLNTWLNSQVVPAMLYGGSQ